MDETNPRVRGLIEVLRRLAREPQDGKPLEQAGRDIGRTLAPEMRFLRQLYEVVAREAEIDPRSSDFWATIPNIITQALNELIEQR